MAIDHVGMGKLVKLVFNMGYIYENIVKSYYKMCIEISMKISARVPMQKDSESNTHKQALKESSNSNIARNVRKRL